MLQVSKDREDIKKRFIALKNLCRSMAEGVSKKKQDRALGQLKELQQQFRFMDEEYKTFRGEVSCLSCLSVSVVVCSAARCRWCRWVRVERCVYVEALCLVVNVCLIGCFSCDLYG